jgi:hypothetical protein
MPISTTEVIGFCETMIEFMKSNQESLKQAGLDVSAWISEVDGKKQSAVKSNDEQEAMKAKLKEKTKETDAAKKIAYDTASSKLDALIGTIGKTTELGKQAAKLRSKIRTKAKPKKKAT